MSADHRFMSVELVVARIAEIRQYVPGPVPVQVTDSPVAFSSVLASATASPPSRSNAGDSAATFAAAEVGVREAPPGSNDSPRIAEYRRSVPGGPVGPWCAYFASWVSARAGTPLGDAGQGFARVDDVWSWASRTGRTLKRSDVPRPGDLILWDEHMGVVEKVGPRGELTVVEGNSSDAVSRRNYGPDAGGAVGFVRPGAR